MSQPADLPPPTTSAASLSKPSVRGSNNIAAPHSESKMRAQGVERRRKIDWPGWETGKTKPNHILKGAVAGRGGVSARVE